MGNQYDDVRDYEDHFDSVTASMDDETRREYADSIRQSFGYQLFVIEAQAHALEAHTVIEGLDNLEVKRKKQTQEVFSRTMGYELPDERSN